MICFNLNTGTSEYSVHTQCAGSDTIMYDYFWCYSYNSYLIHITGGEPTKMIQEKNAWIPLTWSASKKFYENSIPQIFIHSLSTISYDCAEPYKHIHGIISSYHPVNNRCCLKISVGEKAVHVDIAFSYYILNTHKNPLKCSVSINCTKITMHFSFLSPMKNDLKEKLKTKTDLAN